MRSILVSILKRGFLDKRFVVIILLIAFFPIALNLYIMYQHTIGIIKEEKKTALDRDMDEIVNYFELALMNIQKKAREFAENKAIRKSIQDFPYLSSLQKQKIMEYFNEKFSDFESDPYIEKVLCITERGEVYPFSEDPVIYPPKFLESPLFAEFKNQQENERWFYGEYEGITSKNEKAPLFFLLCKLKAIGSDDFGLTDPDRNLGYLFIILNEEKLMEVFDGVLCNNSGLVRFYDRNRQPVMRASTDDIPEQLINHLIAGRHFSKAVEVQVKGEPQILELVRIPSLDWYMAILIPVEGLVGSVKASLLNNMWILVFVGLIIAAWLAIETIFVSKLLTEKEINNYRMILTQETNQKLRLYKHDFSNHMQVIQGLLQLGHTQKAIEYIKTVNKEGQNICRNFDIGIPELESAVFSSLISAKEKGIKVQLDVITLPEDWKIDTYALIKIITNLLKNAIFALEHSGEEEKILSLEIYEEDQEYVFEVTNNVPIIPEEIRYLIFEKGFTTKGKDGNGLGLYIVQELTKKNKGTVELIVDEAGNHFIVRFPREIK